MNLNDLLHAENTNIDPQEVLVLRHTPKEPRLKKVLPHLAAEKPNVFNAYQQTQGAAVEKAMKRAKFVASFIGHEPGKALFVGLYRVGEVNPLTQEQYWRIPELIEMRDKYGMKGFDADGEGRSFILWFDLSLTDVYAPWKGKLIVGWPGREINWSRWAGGAEMPVLAILRESELIKPMPNWKNLAFTWEELKDLPNSWEAALRQWRAIYYIFDVSDNKAYVGSAYGDDNLLARWRNYASTGHGGNSLLRDRNPINFRFTVLEITSQDMDKDDVIRLENIWKERLHTRSPHGLNDN